MTEMQKSLALFTGSVNPELAEEIAKNLGTSLGNVKLAKFANGEIYARYQEKRARRRCVPHPIGERGQRLRRQRRVDGAAHHGRCRQARFRAHGVRRGRPLRLRAPGPQGSAARAHHGETRRRSSGGVRRRQRHHHRSASGRHPGLLRHPREPHDGHAHFRGLLQEQGFRHR